MCFLAPTTRAAAALASCLALLSPLQVRAQATPELQQGIATHYDATGPVSCAFDLDPRERMIAAMNEEQYGQADWCGAQVRVEGPQGNSIVVRIVNRCPECKAGHLDLSREAFAQLADLVTGKVQIRWQLVSPPLQGPIAYHFKRESNPYWLAVQVRNHRNPLVRLEYEAGDQWVEVPRKDYNYFEMQLPGRGPRDYRFRVTDLFGHQLVDDGIRFRANATVKGQAQFPAAP
ncbi:expansin EXLX1 family cellulose-binding protein [Sphaerotilus natans]|uniref:expansin EXLX1 family cellulose-binding protein n=1 Tax=Sphaerotilus natans TaxID=34103 RepID=UPI00406C8FB9